MTDREPRAEQLVDEAPLVSIVVRTKDRPRLLRRAVADIARQTMTQWECVIVNDGGDPEAAERALDGLDAQTRSRVRFLHAETSRGRWRSANAGVLATHAPLIVLHDDDDSWHVDFLSRAVEYLSSHPERDGVVARIEILWEGPDRTGEDLVVHSREIFQPQLQDLLLSDALLFNRFVPIGFVYRRSLHAELGLYDESLPVVGDWAFNLKVLARGPLEYLPGGPLAYWHQRVGVDGAEGNSVIAASRDHDRFDARIRDAALREHISAEGFGLALYLTKFIDQKLLEADSGLRAEVAALRETIARGPFPVRALRLVGRTISGRQRRSTGKTPPPAGPSGVAEDTSGPSIS